ncbi:hypothetical protein J5N97_011317 [Dioscorea zingiberensis]|uniref:RRM domain-containing protein n=1 Tax=Dioscorea zingiberensis TaxID=325984 RepID=A0A9D5D252_9LILI|nr:hypothetical protein J5N97_011317 [Dioscorea zingiberensis]
MEDVAPYQEKLDLNFAMNKGEQVLESYDHENHTPKNVMQAEILIRRTLGLLYTKILLTNEGDPITNVISTADGSCFAVESNMYTDDIDGRRCGDHADGTMAIEDGHYHDKDDVVECVGVSGNTINDYSTENSDKERVDEEADASSLKQLSAVDNHNDWSVEASDHETKDAHPFDESANEEFGNSQLEKTKLVSQEMGGGSFSPQNEMDEDIRPPRMASSDNGEDNGERYYISSPQRGKADMPSPERQFSVSQEKSPHIHSSAGQEELTNSDKKLMHSPNSSRHKHSLSPEKHVVGRKRASSRDRSSPSTRRKSPSGRTSSRDSHKDYSPRKHLSRSGDSRGFGFLSLERDEDADAAIRALDQTEWNNRIILVEKSKTSCSAKAFPSDAIILDICNAAAITVLH